MDLSKFIVLSTDGSFFGADTAFLIDTTKLTEKQLELLCNGSDSDRFDLTVTDGMGLEELLNVKDVLAALGINDIGHSRYSHQTTVANVTDLEQIADAGKPDSMEPVK